ncbi:hypothetical protein Bca4012_001640 [Brassica carinata]|uniref:Uncharacterized protein n=3 Tax=Brassica TaxID=3705 RepID=A0A0D3B400_BRAOL|nr:hypothetical protein Bca52824_043562 [Brassica carinata]VDC88355.1 unnamed protein product [Brassica oleracea]
MLSSDTIWFTFTSIGEAESMWNLDGEIFEAHHLSSQVLRGLIPLFASGPEILRCSSSSIANIVHSFLGSLYLWTKPHLLLSEDLEKFSIDIASGSSSKQPQ